MYIFEIKRVYHYLDNTMAALVWYAGGLNTDLLPIHYDYDKESFFIYIPAGFGKDMRYYFNPAEHDQEWPIRRDPVVTA